MATEEKIYGAFAYKTATDRTNKDWAKKETASTLLLISKKANSLLDSKKYHAIDIMVYEPKKMSWKLVSSKLRSNLK